MTIPIQDDPRVINAYNGMSPSGDAEADVVYANYGSPEDFKKLKEMDVDVRGKIAIVRYGAEFPRREGVCGAGARCRGVMIYSDPWDDGYYAVTSIRKDRGVLQVRVQRGSVGYHVPVSRRSDHAGNWARLLGLPDSKRVSPADSRGVAEDSRHAAVLRGRFADS